MSGPLFLDTVDGASGVDTGDIPASLRHRRSGSCYSQRTPPTAGDRLVWTYSVWFKRGALGTQQWLLDAGADGNNESGIVLEANDTLQIYNYVAASYGKWLITNAVLRDPSSFYHLVVSSNGTTWFKVYLNGVELTSFSTNTGTNGTNWFFNSSTHFMRAGARFNGTGHFDGQIARECFVANSALAASDFGYFNTETNEWVTKTAAQVKAVVDAGGANSSMRDFDDPNFATYNVGKDYSSKGNHWTPNNFSLTAGTSYDWMLDVPGNSFATLSPLVVPELATTLNSGNLQFSGAGQVVGTIPLMGDSYFEYQMTNATASSVGVCPVGTTTRGGGGTGVTNSAVYASGGGVYLSGSLAGTFASYTSSDVIGIQYQRSTGYVSFYKNNVFQATVTVPPSVEVVPYALGNTGATGSMLFGQAPLHASATYHSAAGGYFRYTPPSGYKALCQRNMPDPAILNPEKHFDVKLHVGNAASQKVTSDFKPGLVWIKRRNISATHSLFDEIRGASVSLHSETTGADDSGTSLNSLDADGFTLGNNANTNSSPDTFVDWLWKAGGAAVTNNAGSISSQVSANVTAGFSIVTYTGTGANATVGHGLGKAPGLVIVKNRTGSANNWPVYHQGLTSAAYALRLNSTVAQSNALAWWNSTAPTSSVFSLGTEPEGNGNTLQMVAYCFAEIPGFSKIFSYTGNGSADGPFVHCGFKPKFILYKRSDVAANWVIWDSLRSPDNVVNDYLLPDSSAAEAALDVLDILSNGFKLRTTNADNNGGTIVGIAFADVPAKYALAR